jgi:hypothetical protein
MVIPTFGVGTNLPFLQWQVIKHESSAFTGAAAANRHGDIDGTNNPYSIFTVTGVCVIWGIWGICNTTVTDVGAATSIEIGVSGNTAGLMTQVADATTITATNNIFMWDTTIANTTANIANNAGNLSQWIIDGGSGEDIIESLNVATGGSNVNAGQIDYYCMWAPCESGASIISATAVA